MCSGRMAGAFHRVVRRGISPSVVAEGAGEEVLALARPTSTPFATIQSFGRYAPGATHSMGRGVQLRRVATYSLTSRRPERTSNSCRRTVARNRSHREAVGFVTHGAMITFSAGGLSQASPARNLHTPEPGCAVLISAASDPLVGVRRTIAILGGVPLASGSLLVATRCMDPGGAHGCAQPLWWHGLATFGGGVLGGRVDVPAGAFLQRHLRLRRAQAAADLARLCSALSSSTTAR